MSKIICEVCGTTYPDTASQCPICGCSRPENPQTLENDAFGEERGSDYTYVKGGRFSKSNVRKRNNMAKAVPAYSDDEPEEDDDDVASKESNRGLTIAIVVLLLAIVAVAAYIYIRFFMPENPKDDPKSTTPGTSQTTPAPSETDPTTPPESTPEQTTPPSVPCTSVKLTENALTFSQLGSTWQLAAAAEPGDTTDTITYSSSDPKVATVDATGKITVVGEGSATIIATCGDQTAECVVTVVLPTEPKEYKISHTDVTIDVGETFTIRLRDEDKNQAEVTWTSSNSGICTVRRNGTVEGVSEGTAYVRCTHEGKTYECIVRVKPTEPEETEAEATQPEATQPEGTQSE